MNKHSNDISQNLSVKVSANSDLRTKIDHLIKSVNDGLYEKENIVKIAILAVLAGQNIFLFGPPGTAKSMISRKIANMFMNANYFEHLMHRFCTPEELFGPISLTELKKDIYNRKLDGYLADADFAFLDEIWKSSPAVLNTLLTLINEHKYHNGNTIIDTPMKSLISASNEIPMADDGLSALYDRFLVRLIVNPVHEIKTFKDLIMSLSNKKVEQPYTYLISSEEYRNWLDKINDVELSEECADAICYMRQTIDKYLEYKSKAEENIENENNDTENKFHDNKFEKIKLSYISDRRWIQTIKLVKASAFYNGHNQTKLKDLMILKHALWSDVDEIDSFENLVRDAIEGQLKATIASINIKLDNLEQLANEVADPSIYMKENIRIRVKSEDDISLSYVFTTLSDENYYSRIKYNDNFSSSGFAMGQTPIDVKLVQTIINSQYTKSDILGKETNYANLDISKLKTNDLIKIRLKLYGSSNSTFAPGLGCGLISYTVINDLSYRRNKDYQLPTIFLPTAIYQILNQIPIDGLELYARVDSYDLAKSQLKLNFKNIFNENAEPEKHERIRYCDRVKAIYSFNETIDGALQVKNNAIKLRIKEYPITEEILNTDIKIAVTMKGDVVFYNSKISQISIDSLLYYENDCIDKKCIFWEKTSLNWLFKTSVFHNCISRGSIISTNPHGSYIFDYKKLNCVCSDGLTYCNSNIFIVEDIDNINNVLILKKKDETIFDNIWIDYNHLISSHQETYIAKNELSKTKCSYKVMEGTNSSKFIELTSYSVDDINHQSSALLDANKIAKFIFQGKCKDKTASFNVSQKILSTLSKLTYFIKEVNKYDIEIKDMENNESDNYNKHIEYISSDLFMSEHDKNELSEIYTKKYIKTKDSIIKNKSKFNAIKDTLRKLA